MQDWLFRSPGGLRRQGAAPRGHSLSLARSLGFELLEDRRMMAADMWVGGSGDWSSASHWSAGVPTSTSDVQLLPNVTVTISSGARAANSVTIASTETLSITGGSLTITAALSNSGTLTAGPHTTITPATFSQASTGILNIQLGGGPTSGAFGVVNATGAATLGGTFKANLVSGYTPSNTDSFTPLGFASATGAFSTISLPSGSNYQFASASTFTNIAISAKPTTAVTSTINANSNVGAATTNLLGINLAYWDSQQGTSKTQTLVGQAGLNMYRFPGGSAADQFHFNVTDNLDDSGANTIPQFAQFISQAGGTGVVTIDYGSGSPQEAAAELAYLQGVPTDTTPIGTGLEWNDTTSQWQSVNWNTVGYWASLRAASPIAGNSDGLNFLRINQLAPFADIKYWEIGNEEYGGWETDNHGIAGPGGVSTGAPHDPATYATFAAQFATLAAEITKTAGLSNVSIGIDSEDPTGADDGNWTKNVLIDGANIGFVPGFISDHSYMQEPGTESDSFLLNDSVSDSGSILDWSTRYADYAALLQQTLASKASTVTVMATEFNSVSYNPGKQTTSLVNGLFIADSIGSLLDSGYQGAFVWDLRNAWQTGDNQSNLLYGWREAGDYGQLGDPNYTGVAYTGANIGYPGYYALQLVSKIDVAGGQVVSATSNYGDLDVYAVRELDGHLELLVVNTNPVASLTDQFNLTGFQPGGSAQVWQYGETQDTAQSQSGDGSSKLANSTASLTVNSSNFSYAFPAYSMTVLDLSPVTVVTPSGAHASYTAGAAAVRVDPSIGVSSSDTKLSGATVTISPGTLQAGDTLGFTSPVGSGISIASNTGGVLTLTGSATPAQYQAALQSVTFSSTSISTTARAISIVAIDTNQNSAAAAEQVNVVAPAKVTGVYVSGSAWSSTFDAYLATQGVGNATLGYALPGGTAELTSPLPWDNIDTISVQFSQPVNVAGGITVASGSLELLGGTGAGITAPPAVSSFSFSGNTATWVFSGPLTNNQYVIGLASTSSSFGTPVTDTNGAGLDGEFTKSVTNLPSGNGLAGGTFDFWFNVLPGDANQSGTIDASDVNAIADELGKTTRSGTPPYAIFADIDGSGVITATDVNDASAVLGKVLNRTAPSTPSIVQVGGVEFTALALAVQETGSAQPASVQANSSQANGSQTGVAGSTDPLGTVSADDTNDNTPDAWSKSLREQHGRHDFKATDEALSDFDLVDLWV